MRKGIETKENLKKFKDFCRQRRIPANFVNWLVWREKYKEV